MIGNENMHIENVNQSREFSDFLMYWCHIEYLYTGIYLINTLFYA